MVALVPIFGVVIGALVYGFSPAGSKVCELGRLTFGASLLVALLATMGRTVHLF